MGKIIFDSIKSLSFNWFDYSLEKSLFFLEKSLFYPCFLVISGIPAKLYVNWKAQLTINIFCDLFTTKDFHGEWITEKHSSTEFLSSFSQL